MAEMEEPKKRCGKFCWRSTRTSCPNAPSNTVSSWYFTRATICRRRWICLGFEHGHWTKPLRSCADQRRAAGFRRFLLGLGTRHQRSLGMITGWEHKKRLRPSFLSGREPALSLRSGACADILTIEASTMVQEQFVHTKKRECVDQLKRTRNVSADGFLLPQECGCSY